MRCNQEIKKMANHLSRRDLMRGVLAGAVSFALTPTAAAQLGPPPGVITLRYNENPYGPSPGALKAAAEAAALGAYYPEEIETNLRRVIANRKGLRLENIVLSSGSNEALQAALVAWGKKGRILLPELTYSDHLAYAQRMGVELLRIPLRKDGTSFLSQLIFQLSQKFKGCCLISLIHIKTRVSCLPLCSGNK